MHKQWRQFFVFLIWLWLSGRGGLAQEFTQSPAMDLFNQGRYDQVVTAVPQWLTQNNVAPELQGVARYFWAESHYNLGLAAATAPQALAQFRSAQEQFEQCLTRDDVKVLYKEFFYQAQYKKGWTLLRRAELGDGTVADRLNAAYNSFNALDNQAPAELKACAAYLAGEARLRQAVLERYEVFSHTPSAADINRLLSLLNDARASFQEAAANNGNQPLQPAAQIRLRDVDFETGKTYQGIPEELLAGINDANKQASAAATAAWYFNRANYAGLPLPIDLAEKQKIEPIRNYSEAMQQLNSYLATGDDQAALQFGEKIDGLDENYNTEKLFRRGNRDQARRELEQGPFVDLTLPNTSYYARAAAVGLPESFFWLGFVQAVRNLPDSPNNFAAFLTAVGSAPADLRLRLLVEEAQLLNDSLNFRTSLTANQTAQLMTLRNQLANFQPQTGEIQQGKNRLLVRIQIAIAVAQGGQGQAALGNIWSNILHQDLNLGLAYIRDLLPSTAAVIGPARVPYINLLNPLLQITQNQRTNETNFYRGITESLNAEIQPTQTQKEAEFRRAAATLAAVTDIYQAEAKYIQARALFYARDYDASERLFMELINQHGSLRALFYLGEVFRERQNGVAAKRCYRVVQDKARSIEFWYVNASTGIAQSNNLGTEEPLANVNFNQVHFPDVMLTIAGQPLTYEGLADARFLQAGMAKQGVTLLAKFGLPKRSLYPSINRLANSTFVTAGTFTEYSAPINEMRGAIDSGLELRVLLPVEVSVASCEVTLDGQPLPIAANGVYGKKPIPLNSTHKIMVTNSGSYPYQEEHVFQRPGLDSVFVVLTPRFTLTPEKGAVTAPMDYYQQRLDRNMILHSAAAKLETASLLYQDFAANLFLRDYVYHPQLRCYLVVDSDSNRILRYSETGKEGELRLSYGDHPDSLNSPEGITLDSNGRIYLTDWGNHRVLIFNNDGTLAQKIGRFGENKISGDSAKFIFPTRIAVVEDTIGVLSNGKKYFADRQIFVADRNGIHLIDANGYYLATLIQTSEDFPVSSFYGIAAQGFGQSAELFVVQRQKGEILRFIGKTPK